MEFIKQDRDENDYFKTINYFVFLAIIKKVLDINYYNIIYSTSFSPNVTDDIKEEDKSKFTDLGEIIKPNGILICSKDELKEDFRHEVKLLLSNIFAPFNEYYVTQIYNRQIADKEFRKKVEAHRHTLINMAVPLNSMIQYDESIPPYYKYAAVFLLTCTYDIVSVDESTRRSAGKLLSKSDKPEDILKLFVKYIKSGIEKKDFVITLEENITNSTISLDEIEKLDFFTIIFNIIHNARKHATGGVVNIYTKSDDDSYSITVDNPQKMHEKAIAFINSINSKKELENFDFDDKLIKRTGGLAIMKGCQLEYSWLLSAECKDNRTFVKLTIKK